MDELNDDRAILTVTQTVDESGFVVLGLRGELDFSTSAEVRDAVSRLVEAQVPGLIFDLTELSFSDSSGISVMLFAHNNLPDVRLRHPSSIVERAIQTMGLAEVLQS